MAAGRIKGITIEIGGDTSKLVKALASVDNAISRTQANLRDINKALKFDPTNTTLLKDKQQELGKQIEATEKRIEEEKKALEQLNEKLDQPFDLDHAEEFQKNAKAAEDLKLQIDLDTAALKQLGEEAKQASSIIGIQMQAAGQKIQEVGAKITQIGDGIARIGQNMTTYITTPIVTGFGAAVKSTMDFDSAMSTVQATAGATAQDMEQLRDKAKEMGETTQFSATESAEALNYMAMAGWKTEDMLGGIEGIMHLAAASGEELATTSDIVTDALTAFGMEAQDAGRFADVLAAAATNANTNVAMMGESFKYVAPVAGSLGYSCEDVSIALGLMANSGIKADMAGTSLRNMLQRMAKPTKESQAAMDRLGLSLEDDSGRMYSFREIMDQLRVSFADINISAEDYIAELDALDAELESGNLTQAKYNAALEELNKQCFGAEGAEKARAAAMLGGTRAMSGLLAIANATESDYEKLTAAIDNSSQSFAKLADGSVVPLNEALESGQEIIEQYTGAAEAMAAVRLDNLGGDITLLKSQIEGLAISYGELLMPYIRQAVERVSEFITKLQSLDDAQKMQIIQIAAVVAAIGPALLIIGKMVSSIGSIVTTVGKLTSGVGSLLTSFGGLQGVLAALTGPIGIVVAAVAALAAGFAYLFATNEDFRNSVTQVASTIKDNLAKAMEHIGPKLQELGERFNSLMTTLAPVFEGIFTMVVACVNGIIATIGPVVDVISGIIEVIMGIFQAFFALFTGDWDSFWEGVESILDGAVNIIEGVLNAGTAFWEGIMSTFGVNLKNTVTDMWEKVKTTIKNKIDAIKTDIETKWTHIKEWLATTLTNIWDKFKEIFDNIKQSVKEKIDNVKDSIQEGMENALEYLSSLPQRFFDWGHDMIQNLIDGIKSKWDDFKNTVVEIADTIAEYVHFSEPDKGPLSNFHTFMPDMIDLMVSGINQGIPKLQQAMGNMTGSMASSMQGGTTYNGNTSVNLTVYGAPGQDVTQLARIIEQQIAENSMRRGVAAI